jgi:predicted DNA-binding protein (MmcQ/YjbR family)
MTLNELKRYCLSKENVTSEYLHEGILTFKLKNKVFCYCYELEQPLKIILKADPLMAQSLRRQYPEIKEGFKWNNNSWNTITLSRSLLPLFVEELIDHSHELIEASLAAIADTPVIKIRPAVKQEAFAAVNLACQYSN